MHISRKVKMYKGLKIIKNNSNSESNSYKISDCKFIFKRVEKLLILHS